MADQETINILFCGTGGQGILTAAEICGWAAMLDGYHVKKSEVHGMAQRGGSVESHLRFGTAVYSPLIPKGEVDYLVAFETGENSRLKNFLKPGGQEMFNELEKAVNKIEDKRYINTYIIGLLSAKLKINEASWLQAIELVFHNKHAEENKKIFLFARKQGGEL